MDNKRINLADWKKYIYYLPIEDGKKVKEMSFDLKADKFSGIMNITDLQLQSGSQVTAQVPHTSEILENLKYGFAEDSNIKTVSNGVKIGVKPQNYTNLKNRAYNIVGRGHETVVLPNVYHEDYTTELLTSGLDLELYAKEDFDLLRISTNDGALVEGRYYEQPDLATKHPLNYKYTREFYFTGGKAGEKIILSSSLNKASVGTKIMPIRQRIANIGTTKLAFSRQRFMVAPFGSFRLRIEFYKFKTGKVGETNNQGVEIETNYLQDVGIGYYGTAQFKQIKGANQF